MFILLWAGVFLAFYYYSLTNLVGSQLMPADWRFIQVDVGDPRVPSVASYYFDHVADQIIPLGFQESVRIIQPGVIRGMTGFLAVYGNRRTNDSALALVAVRPTNPERTTFRVFQFYSKSIDEREVDTTNATSPIRLHRAHSRVLQQIPDIDDLGTLYNVHRRCVESLGLTHQAIADNPVAAIEEVRMSFQREIASRVDERRIRMSSDGRNYELLFKDRVRAAFYFSAPGKYIARWWIRNRARRRLRELGLGTNYPLQSTIFPRDSVDSKRVRVIGVVFTMSILGVLAFFLFYGLQGTTSLRRFVGIAVAVALLWSPMFIRHASRKQSRYICSICGAKLRARESLCTFCGEGTCTQCGYNLVGNQSGVCPECGTAIVIEEAV